MTDLRFLRIIVAVLGIAVIVLALAVMGLAGKVRAIEGRVGRLDRGRAGWQQLTPCSTAAHS